MIAEESGPRGAISQQASTHERDSKAQPQSPTQTTLLLVCSPGGHLQQMLALEPAWRGIERSWVTLPGPDVGYLLADER